MPKNINEKFEMEETAHPYAMLDDDLPTMISLVHQQLEKERITPKQPLFRIYIEDNQRKYLPTENNNNS